MHAVLRSGQQLISVLYDIKSLLPSAYIYIASRMRVADVFIGLLFKHLLFEVKLLWSWEVTAASCMRKQNATQRLFASFLLLSSS